MRPTTKNKAIRLLTSTLMSSNLTTRELIEISRALKNQDEFTRQLGYHLYKLITVTMDNDNDNESEGDEEKLDYVIRLLKSKNISKSKIVMLIDNILPGFEDYVSNQQLTVRSMLRMLQENTNEAGLDHLLDIIRNDEYLEHILEKN